jgi:leucyl aminopeptidase
VAVVGKGLTFDSGGYNLKAGAGSMIEMMKFDMGGSGATLGAAKALSLLQPEGVEVRRLPNWGWTWCGGGGGGRPGGPKVL